MVKQSKKPAAKNFDIKSYKLVGTIFLAAGALLLFTDWQSGTATGMPFVVLGIVFLILSGDQTSIKAKK